MVYSLSLTIFTIVGVFVQWLVKAYLSHRKTAAANKPNDQDVTLTAPYPCNAIKGSRKFRITMGLRKLDVRNWLTVDKNYMKEHDIRNSLLKNERKKVFECLPESREACAEILEVVSEFLCERYPTMFQMKKDGTKIEIQNIKTGETFVHGGPDSTMEPLEIAVRLAMEDLNVLMRNSEGEYYLYELLNIWTLTLFPLTEYAELQVQLSFQWDGRSSNALDGQFLRCMGRYHSGRKRSASRSTSRYPSSHISNRLN